MILLVSASMFCVETVFMFAGIMGMINGSSFSGMDAIYNPIEKVPVAAAIFKIPVSFPMQILQREAVADASKIGNPTA